MVALPVDMGLLADSGKMEVAGEIQSSGTGALLFKANFSCSPLPWEQVILVSLPSPLKVCMMRLYPAAGVAGSPKEMDPKWRVLVEVALVQAYLPRRYLE